MTRKDYVLIAQAVKSIRTELNADMLKSETAHDWDKNLFAMVGAKLVAKKIAEALEMDNPRFDRSRFYKECDIL